MLIGQENLTEEVVVRSFPPNGYMRSLYNDKLWIFDKLISPSSAILEYLNISRLILFFQKFQTICQGRCCKLTSPLHHLLHHCPFHDTAREELVNLKKNFTILSNLLLQIDNQFCRGFENQLFADLRHKLPVLEDISSNFI